ncbi:hypothetical protein T484DRAFT_1913323, partial [Baffinella frigidus]
MSGEVVARAPFECVCGFTAGTSFAWEKHLALRNTPYSSVKHSRVIRGADLGHRGVETRGGDSGGAKAPDYDRYDRDTSWGISSPAIPTAEPHYPHQYPSPKALFRETRPTNNLSDSMAHMRLSAGSSPAGASLSGGMRLEEAARAGDMDRVARIAVELLRLAQQGDAQGVLGAIAALPDAGRKDARRAGAGKGG